MSEFSNIVKQFSITPVIQGTVTNTKPLTTTPVQAVGLIGQQIILSPISFHPPTTLQQPQIFYQWNFSSITPFRVTNFGQLRAKVASMIGCSLCIRFVLIGVTYRYFLTGSTPYSGQIPSVLYIGQLIYPNFVIEMWQTTDAVDFGIVNALTITLSGIRNPVSSTDNVPDLISPAITVTMAQLQAAINPEALPTTYNSLGSWNFN